MVSEHLTENSKVIYLNFVHPLTTSKDLYVNDRRVKNITFSHVCLLSMGSAFQDCMGGVKKRQIFLSHQMYIGYRHVSWTAGNLIGLTYIPLKDYFYQQGKKFKLIILDFACGFMSWMEGKKPA